MTSSSYRSTNIHAPQAHFGNEAGRDQYNLVIDRAYFTHRTEDDAVLASLRPVRTSYYVQPCMSGTRQWLINKIDDWLVDHQAPNILLLSGSPGAGKSAIASTLVSNLQGGRLGSSFFCKRDDIALGDPAVCWRTIAFDLARYDSVIARRMVENIKGRKVDPERADIESHFKYLIEDPLREVWQSRAEALAGMHDDMEVAEGSDARDRSLITGLPVVVIDALDECGSDIFQSAQ